MRASAVLLSVALLLAGCSDGDDDDPVAASSSTTSSTTTTSPVASSTSSPPVTLTPFEGSTEPITSPLGAQQTMLLRDVSLAHESSVDRVVFEFENAGAPAVDLRYVEEVRADGSGDLVTVDGQAFLQVRMEPAATADLSGDEVRRTYEGPDRVTGDTEAVTEVVRTGDFEANLTWVIGLPDRLPFRLSFLPDPARVVVEIGVS